MVEHYRKMKKMRKEAIFLLLIFALALFLRVYDLGKESIWLDEGFALQAIDRNALEVVKWTADFDPIPPFYYVALHYWSSIFGTSEAAIRFLSIIANMLTMLFVFVIANKIFNKKVALITALIFSTSMLEINYSQEARSFALFSMLAWLSTLLFIYFIKCQNFPPVYNRGSDLTSLKMLENSEHAQKPPTSKETMSTTFLQSIDRWFLTGKKYFIPYIIVSALALYTLQLMLLVLFAHTTIIFLQKKKEIYKKWLLGQGIILLLFIPWWKVFMKQFLLINELFQAGFIQRLHLPYFIGILGIFWVIFGFAIFYALFLYIYNARKELLRKIILNDFLFITGVAAALIIFIILMPKLTASFLPARYALFLLPIFYIFFAYKINGIKNKKMAALLLILVLAVNSFALYSYYAKTTKPEWKETVEYINSNAQEGDAVVFDTGFSEIIYNYYGGKLKWHGLETRPFSLEKNSEYIESIKPELKQGTGVWLVLYRNFVTKEIYKESLERDFKLASEKEFTGIKIYYYKTSKSENGR